MKYPQSIGYVSILDYVRIQIEWLYFLINRLAVKLMSENDSKHSFMFQLPFSLCSFLEPKNILYIQEIFFKTVESGL